MKTLTCPCCGAAIAIYRAFRPAIKPFWARCGWNLQRAEIALGRQSSAAKLVPIAIAVVGLFVTFAAAKAPTAGRGRVAVVFGTILLLRYWSVVSGRKQIAASKSSANAAFLEQSSLYYSSLVCW